MAVVMQRAFPAYKASKKLANTKKSEGYLWGIGTGVCALAAVGVCLYDSPLSLIAMHVFESVGARCAVKTGITWEKQKKWKKCMFTYPKLIQPDTKTSRYGPAASKAIFDIGTASHEIWLFMMLYHMRLNGLVTQDTVAFLQFAKNIAETFDGVDVIENWGDINYVQSWVKGQAEYIQERLADVHARDD
ncbi:hypothetical protein EV426DRAFT_341697 [Tirmania nivea]|nr:hypothetical protein EV426DRAFT_341697 [Tirmania nivea]